jgi:Protein of unknown function (DUF2958)
MKLLTDELRAQLPALYAQEGVEDPIVHIKYFTPDSGWAWYVTEGQPEEDDFLFFGFVVGFCSEWGYFALSEMEEACGPRGLPIERDLHFKPAPWSEVQKRERLDDDYRPPLQEDAQRVWTQSEAVAKIGTFVEIRTPFYERLKVGTQGEVIGVKEMGADWGVVVQWDFVPADDMLLAFSRRGYEEYLAEIERKK